MDDMTTDPAAFLHERRSFVIVDRDLPEHSVMAAASQKAGKLVTDPERVREVNQLGPPEPYGDRGLQVLHHFSYWVDTGP
jgi:hypothetical protein